MLEREKSLRDNPQSYSIRMIARSNESMTCEYECTNASEFVVQGEVDNSLVTFAACCECLNDHGIYPVDGGWVDSE